MSIFEELKRRNVFRVGIAYAITAWLLAQVADILLENFGAPAWVMQSFLVLLVLGFPLALFLAWAFELTPEGVKRDANASSAVATSAGKSRRLDRTIIVVLALAVGFLLYRQMNAPSSPEKGSGSISQAEQAAGSTGAGVIEPDPFSNDVAPEKSVAVLPFVAMSSGENDEYFADGLTEEILNALAQLQGLHVTARTSSFFFKGQDLPVPDIAAQLGVANIVEGSVRRNADQVRVTAQLVRAADGFHLWSDTFDGSVHDGFDMQTRIAENVALALDVVLDDTQRQRMRLFGIRNPGAFIAFQKGMDLFTSAHGSGNADQLSLLRDANVYFEQVMELVPDFMGAYQRHSDFYTHIALDMASGELENGFEGISIESALRAAEADFEAAFENAPDALTRAEADLDRIVISGNWRGLSTAIDRALTTDNCSNPIWAHIVSSPFGKADAQFEDSLRDTQCDPLRPGGHVDLISAAIWQGDFQKALEISTTSLQTTSGDWLATMRVQALLANGALDQAERAIHELIRAESWIEYAQMKLAAARGNAALLAELEGQANQAGDANDNDRLESAALRGDREAANRYAAAIDARPLGPMKLVQSVYTCLCGAPFDLEATPNFAQKLEEAGLPWPPPDTIAFPLKTW